MDQVALTVWAHDSTAYTSEVVVDLSLLGAGTNVGDVAQLRTAKGRSLNFIVRPKNASSSAQISVSPGVMSALDLAPRSQVFVRRISDPAKVVLDVVELHFKGIYLTRTDEYRIAQFLTGQCVWAGQRVPYLGGLVRMSADVLYRRGHRVFSGLVTPETRLIFRSDSSRMLIFIQMSAEMWNFDETGDIMFHRLVNSFLPEMMHRWRDQGDHHLASILLFTSVATENGKKNFYRVVVDQVHVSRWSDIMRLLRTEFARFPRDVLVNPTTKKLEGEILPSNQGNVLEAFELATTLLTSKFDDKDLCRATSQCLVVTPGPGSFSCSIKELHQLSRTLLSVEIGVELVCLARPPLHVTPLFCAYNDITSDSSKNEYEWCVPTWINVSFWNSPDRYVKQWIPRCRTYDLQTKGLVESEARGFNLHSLTPQPTTLDSRFMRQYDQGVFRSIGETRALQQLQASNNRQAVLRPPTIVGVAARPTATPTSVSMLVNAPLPRVSAGGARSVLSGLLRKKPSVGILKTSSDSQYSRSRASSLQQPLEPMDFQKQSPVTAAAAAAGNPPSSRVIKSSDKTSGARLGNGTNGTHTNTNTDESSALAQKDSSETDAMWRTLPNPAVVDNPSRLKAYGRWANVYPPGRRQNVVSWRSLKSPASLPLTSESFPSVAQFQREYKFQFYQVVPDDASPGSLAAVVEEMVGLRLQMGFQIAVGAGVNRVEATLPRGRPDRVTQIIPSGHHAQGSRLYMVRMGLVHRLAVEDGQVDVQLYTWVGPGPGQSQPSKNTTLLVKTKYDTMYHAFDARSLQGPQLNWSQLDQQLSDSDEDVFAVGNATHLVAIRFAFIPIEVPHQGLTTLTPEETQVEGITRVVNTLLRHRVAKSVVHEAFPVSFYTGPLTKAVDEMSTSGALGSSETGLQRNRLTRNISLQDLAAEMRGRMGIPLRTRRWHWKQFHGVFLGDELVAWLVNTFSDITTPEEAVEYGRQLMERGLFRHPEDRHSFHDGYYFYQFCPEYADNAPDAENPSSTTSSLGGGESNTTTGKKPRITLSQAIRIDVDPKRLSRRREHIQVHIDRVHNPENCFHFQVEWLNTTPRLVDDLFASLARLASRYGLRLVQVPVAAVSRTSVHSPFRSLLTTPLAVQPPPLPGSVDAFVGRFWFQHFLLRKYDFVFDLPDFTQLLHRDYVIEFSWGPLQNANPQYIHRSGTILAQITPQGEFAMTPNTIHISRLSFGGGGTEATKLIREFAALCGDADRLRALFTEAQEVVLSSQSSSVSSSRPPSGTPSQSQSLHNSPYIDTAAPVAPEMDPDET